MTAEVKKKLGLFDIDEGKEVFPVALGQENDKKKDKKRKHHKNKPNKKQKVREHVVAISVKEDHNALRKNKAFLQLKREMEHRSRQRRKALLSGEPEVAQVEEVFYVDRDRAAAVVLGNKDIKRDLSVKKKRDRMENSVKIGKAMEDVNYETYLLQGDHELRSGDPKRALFYLSSACENAPDGDPTPFMKRSQCFSKLGLYEEADEDADKVLELSSGYVKGLINKAETQYNLGNFEHAMKFFHRANSHRPGYHGVQHGIIKARNAIENSLSKAKGFSFNQMEDVIELIQEHDRILQELREREKLKRLGQYESSSSSSSSGSSSTSSSGSASPESVSSPDSSDTEEVEDSEETLHRLQAAKAALDNPDLPRNSIVDLDIPELEGLWQPRPLKKASSQEKALKKQASEEDKLVREKSRAKNARTLKRANKQLLGELYHDQMYLQGLLTNPLLNKPIRNDKDAQVRERVHMYANEALSFLEVRKSFWQQQKPVYARKNELHLKKTAIYGHDYHKPK